jgi:SAM-dependent methyltransferase
MCSMFVYKRVIGAHCLLYFVVVIVLQLRCHIQMQTSSHFWGRVYSPQTDEDRKLAATLFAEDDPIEYLNGLHADPAIAQYKAFARDTILKCTPRCVIDLGCGSGLDLKLLACALSTSDVEFFGLDPSPAFVKATKDVCKELSNVHVMEGGGERLSELLPGKVVDVVRVDRVLQHLDKPLIVNIMKQIHTVLRPGGVCVVTEPLWSGRHLDFGLNDADSARVEEDVYNHPQLTLRNPSIGRELVKYCCDAGLRILDVQVHTSIQRNLDEYNRVTRCKYYTHIERFFEVSQRAIERGSFCCSFPFYTVVAAKPKNNE